MKCVETETGEIAGMGLGDILIKPRTLEERQYQGAPWLEGEQRERAEKILKPLWSMREAYFAGQSHIYCHVVAVDPKYQGRKGGAAFCEWALDLGERTGLPVYFESSPSTVKLYLKMGFELLPETIVHKAEVLGTPSDVEVSLMVKMPSAAGNMTFDEWRRSGYPKWEKAYRRTELGGQAKQPPVKIKVVEISESML
ncbi:hypothetical protein F5Y03DRAFT_298769 [Xylaria venustula]|nr:hypothetical protein F5Y03DRAFT_298769 [Xylaria venustula]